MIVEVDKTCEKIKNKTIESKWINPLKRKYKILTHG